MFFFQFKMTVDVYYLDLKSFRSAVFEGESIGSFSALFQTLLINKSSKLKGENAS